MPRKSNQQNLPAGIFSFGNLKILSLCVLPILVFVVLFWIKRYWGPYWLGSNYDPEYVYLLNSLSVTHLLPIGHTDHPGTPLQVLGAAVLIIVRIFRGGRGLMMDVLSNPEVYLNSINIFLVFLLSASLFVIGIMTFYLTKNIFYALIMQSTPFLSKTSLWTLNRVSPELLLVISCLWFSFLVLHFLYQKKQVNSMNILLLSVLTGFSTAVKINALPLLLVGLIILPLRHKANYLIGSVISFFVFTWPIRHSYRNFYDWLYRLATHSGRYGSGDAKFIDLNLFYENFLQLMDAEKFFVVAVFLMVVYLVVFFVKNRNDKKYLVLFAVTIFSLAEVFIVSKHYSIHYLLPGLSMLGLILILLLSFKWRGVSKFEEVIRLVVVLVVFTLMFKNVAAIYDATRGVRLNYTESAEINKLLSEKYEDSTKIFYYRSSSVESALNFGNDHSRLTYSPFLKEMFPNFYYYNIWNKVVYWWGGKIQLSDNRGVIYRGTPFEGSYLKYKPDIELEKVYMGVTEVVYEPADF